MPGFEEGAFSAGTSGAGGAAGKGDEVVSGGVLRSRGMGIEAFFLRIWILSL